MTTCELKSAPIVNRALIELQERCEVLKKENTIPSMKVILVGENPASVLYTNSKKKFCEKFGALCEIIKLPENISENEFLEEVSKIAEDSSVHGCFVQLPLPSQLSHINVGELIPEDKDVDGFNKSNIMKLFLGDCGNTSLLPCTPKGIVSLLNFYNVPLKGQNVTIIGRSHIVGRPLAMLLTNHDATVTLCHSRTKNLQEATMNADIIISAVGKPKFFDHTYINENKRPYLIDVGINKDENNKLCGDVDYEDVYDKVQGVSPVPGGVGPLTILSLAQNLLTAAERAHQKRK